MKIQLKEITVRDLVEGYQDLQENGVVGYGISLLIFIDELPLIRRANI